MKLKVIHLLIPLLWLAINGHAQTEKTAINKNIIHAEAGGIGGYGSLNYERMIDLPGLFSLSGRVGAGTIRIYDFTSAFNPDLLFPVTVNGFYGKDHKIHLGFGQLIANTIHASHQDGNPIRETNLHTNFAIGYRYQKPSGRLVLGISYTPLIEFKQNFRHWGALTVGFAF